MAVAIIGVMYERIELEERIELGERTEASDSWANRFTTLGAHGLIRGAL